MSAIALNLESSCIAIVYCRPCGVCGLSYMKHLFKDKRFLLLCWWCSCRRQKKTNLSAFLFPQKRVEKKKSRAVIFLHGPPPPACSPREGREGGKGPSEQQWHSIHSLPPPLLAVHGRGRRSEVSWSYCTSIWKDKTRAMYVTSRPTQDTFTNHDFAFL